MCKPASFVVTKNKVFWSKNSDSHEDIIQENKLVESVAGNYTFVRVEITPQDGDLSSNTRYWKYKLDQDIVPDWYDVTDVEKRVRIALKKWKKAKVITKGNRTIKSGNVYAYGNSTVTAYDNSTVTAYGNSTVTAYDNSTVTAYDNSTVRACTGHATARIYATTKQPKPTGLFAVVIDCTQKKAVCVVGW